MIDWVRKNLMAAATSAAITLAGLRVFTPGFVDFIIDWLTVGLVFIIVKLAKK